MAAQSFRYRPQQAENGRDGLPVLALVLAFAFAKLRPQAHGAMPPRPMARPVSFRCSKVLFMRLIFAEFRVGNARAEALQTCTMGLVKCGPEACA